MRMSFQVDGNDSLTHNSSDHIAIFNVYDG